MYNDQELVRMTLKGHKDSFDEIVMRYSGKVYNLSLRMLRNPANAEDLTQEAFLRAYRSLDTYNPAYPFLNWLLKITSNLCIDRLRRERDVSFTETDETLDFKSQETYPDPENAVLYNEKLTEIEKVLVSLPPRYQLVLVLRFVEDLKYEQIAEILEAPIGTVKTQIHRARKLIKERYFSLNSKSV
ncbi:MAG: sigma-70 family RNA polymerase sigma factor [Firmicutes bacterium]|nr:sigma-70 family RNA polymerase sigma factor [Bacillota bacterium]MDD4264691.1 sigma-70 family RNA polymerase sigma factor [Bacillota bacterium]MDD4692940.1 sigma-70 family RNA polymerase sigma factor [Bacillota bacterium]